ncbi:hypothetical protein GCM10009076_15730 [Erythrobacter ramosus]
MVFTPEPASRFSIGTALATGRPLPVTDHRQRSRIKYAKRACPVGKPQGSICNPAIKHMPVRHTCCPLIIVDGPDAWPWRSRTKGGTNIVLPDQPGETDRPLARGKCEDMQVVIVQTR